METFGENMRLNATTRSSVKNNECAKNKIGAPLKERHLLVTFVNGVRKVYDCQGILNLERFQLLKREAFFKAVTVDPGGYGVSWDDETDLSEYELWNNGVEVEQGTAWSMGRKSEFKT